MKKSILLLVFIIGFFINLLWENIQAPLYKDYIFDWNHFWYCALASVADAITILILYLGFAVYHRQIDWLDKFNLSSIMILVLLGTVIAILFEKWALKLNQWDYSSKCP